MGEWSLTDMKLLGVLAALLGSGIWWQWIEHLNNVKALKLGHYALKDALKDNYWDKTETQQHIGLVLKPIEQSLNAVAESSKHLTGEIRNLTHALATAQLHKGVHAIHDKGDIP